MLQKILLLMTAGATVTRGILGFGANSRVRSAQILRLSEDLPMIIQIVDEEEKLRAIAEYFDEAVGKGLVTIEPLHVLTYRHQA